MLGSGRLGVQRVGWIDAHQTFLKLVVEADIAAAEGNDMRSHNPSAKFLADLDKAALAEFGFSFSELADIVSHISSIGAHQSTDPRHVMRDDMVSKLRDAIGWDEARVNSAIGMFVLERRADFLQPEPPYGRQDVYPWRFNRRLSYLRRPLISWRDADNREHLVWGARNLLQAYRNIFSLCLSGRYKAESDEMAQLVGKQRHAAGKRFTQSVAAIAETASDVEVRTEVERIAGLRLLRASGQPIGDVDVLVADQYHHIVWAIEAKNLAVARTPAELSNEIADVLKSSDGRSASAEIHMERVEWLKQHRKELLADLGLTDRRAGRWQVRPLIVTDGELLSSHLVKVLIPVISLRRLSVCASTSRRGLEI